MSAAARSLAVFACYLAVVAVGLLLAPNAILAPLGFAPVVDVWVRIVGMLVLVLAIYYFVAAKHEAEPLIRATVPVRASVIVVFGGFVVARLAPPALLGFGGVDLVGAVWTARALAAAKS